MNAILKAARRDIPLTSVDFDCERYLDWAQEECRQGRFWVADIKGQLGGVMLLLADEVISSLRKSISDVGQHTWSELSRWP